MARFKLTIEYDGSQYKGWQMLKNEPTIQGKLIEVCSKILNTPHVEVYGAGRTDAGVHALGQVAHVDAQTTVSSEFFLQQLQAYLPSNISVQSIEHVHDRFHARHHARYRSYIYCISKQRTALFKRYVWWVQQYLDSEQMMQAAELFKGFHDFSSFAKTTKKDESTMVEITHIQIHQVKNCLWIHIVGSHFLWSMVRRIVGVLVEAGKGTVTQQHIIQMLTQYSDFPAQHTAPASGLFLERVYYDHEEIDKLPLFPFTI
jgi:tRNA pseudouridine38-40 synthase